MSLIRSSLAATFGQLASAKTAESDNCESELCSALRTASSASGVPALASCRISNGRASPGARDRASSIGRPRSAGDLIRSSTRPNDCSITGRSSALSFSRASWSSELTCFESVRTPKASIAGRRLIGLLSRANWSSSSHLVSRPPRRQGLDCFEAALLIRVLRNHC